jgi:hypothetical protein
MPRASLPGQQDANQTDVHGIGAARRWIGRGASRKAWYSVLNLARWGILAGFLVFLLTAILALHEALNFQDRVVELAGNNMDRARRVLSVLHDTLEKPEAYPEERELPYASIAVKLDRLNKVQKTLAGFTLEEQGKTVQPVPTGEPPAEAALTAVKSGHGVNGKVAATGQAGASPSDDRGEEEEAQKLELSTTAATHWQAASNRLKLSIADLDGTLKAGDPARQLVEALAVTRKHVRALDSFKGSVEQAKDDQAPSTSGAAHAADSELDSKNNQFELLLVTERLTEGLSAIEQRVAASPDDEFLMMQLDRLRQDVFGLEAFLHAGDLKYEPPAERGHDDGAVPDLDMEIEKIDHRINEIEAILLKTDKGFVAAAKLAELINETRRYSDDLQDMQPVAISHRKTLGEDPTEGTAALAAFEETRGGLSEAIQAIEEQLDRRTRVTAVANQLKPLEDEGEDGRNSRAFAILRDFDAVGRFQAALMPFNGFAETPGLGMLSHLGFDPQHISTLHRETLALLFVFVIGAMGSVIFITKYSIQLVLEGNWLTDQPKRSLAWYLFRPFFGVIVALAAFLLFKAGQLALGNSGVLDGSGDFNLPILSVIALFAGLLSWQALEAIETRGSTWFRSQKRQYLWATGLDNGLRAEMHGRDELASSIGRTADQVFRWVVYRDRVSPEMQDRIADWLDVPYNQLFQNEEPWRKTLWLRIVSKNGDGIKRDEFEQKLASEHFDADKLETWLSQRQAVPPMAHDRILLAMDRPMNEIFTDEKPAVAETPPLLPTGGRREAKA